MSTSNKLAIAALTGLFATSMLAASPSFASEGEAKNGCKGKEVVQEKASCKTADATHEKNSCKAAEKDEKNSCKGKDAEGSKK